MVLVAITGPMLLTVLVIACIEGLPIAPTVGSGVQCALTGEPPMPALIKTMHFRTIWPERRLVTEEQVRSWLHNALADKRLDEDLVFDALVHDDVVVMARALEDAGLITFAV